MMHRLLWHRSCARCLTRDTIWLSVGRKTTPNITQVKSPPYTDVIITLLTWRLNLLLKGRLEHGKRFGDVCHYFLRCVRSLKTEQHGVRNIFPAGCQLFEQCLQPLFVPKQDRQESHRARNSISVQNCKYKITGPAPRTRLWAALSSPPQRGHPPPSLPYVHHSESSCLGPGVSIWSLLGTCGNLWSSTL